MSPGSSDAASDTAASTVACHVRKSFAVRSSATIVEMYSLTAEAWRSAHRASPLYASSRAEPPRRRRM